MAQVAARVSPEHEQWLKEYFRTKSAGAEFVVPWAADTFFRSINQVKGIFSAAELLTILEAHRDVKLLPEQSRLAYLQLRVQDACDIGLLHTRHGAGKANLEAKLKRLNDTQAAAVMIWATAYWVSKRWTEVEMEEYARILI
ncbi:hypothetical protein GGQ74_000183 [Desulfobaculum xiamenense]|uniref:Uncharacterized protein n=1 Tax=Desulfobaculum xiamenense TaxID=995050 RepID=A0A846QK40_9BACT|nr:hypothetical protein [Desulfobaculum xiamenense]NJB66543.1 hypothetical protein [Desulfobaculum xiamenense]